MKLIKITAAVACTLLLLSAKKEKDSGNLVTNGDFSESRLESWKVAVGSHYGQELDYKVKKKTIQFKEIKASSAFYAKLRQYINIEKGKKYRVSFDVMGGKGIKGDVEYFIGRPSYTRTKQGVKYFHIKGKITPTTEWTTLSDEFTGLYDTDNAGMADEGGKKKGKKGKKDKNSKDAWRKKEAEGGKPPTEFSIGVGELTGDLQIRNVVVEEITEAVE